MKVKTKLILGFSAVLFLFAFASGLGYWSLNVSQDIGNLIEKRYVQESDINDLEKMSVELVLNFRNIVIEKEEGLVSSERIQFLSNFKADLKKDVNNILSHAESQVEKKDIQVTIDTLTSMIQLGESQLIPAVQSKASRDVFTSLDHQFDQLELTLHNNISKLTKTIDDKIAEAKAEEENLIQKVDLTIFITAGLGILIGVGVAVSVIRDLMNQLGEEPNVIANIASLIASGDLTRDFTENKKKETGVYLAMREMTESLNQIVTKITEIATNLATTSEEINASASGLSESAQNQAASVEETSASTEELTSAIRNVTDSAMAMSDKSRSSLEETQKYKEKIEKVTQEMLNLGNSTKKIGDIVKVINDIADQTDLLSLNAAIEAARAGEHGRGFSVVAEAISKLAAKSSNATKEIESLIKESVERINKGVESVKESGESFHSIIETIEENNGMVNTIARSMEEQKQGSEQIQKATEDINGVTQNISASAEEMAGSTAELHRMAEDLNHIVAEFKIKEDKKSNVIMWKEKEISKKHNKFAA